MADIYMHYNYFRRNWSLEYCFERAAAYGYDGIEVRLPEGDNFARELEKIQSLKEKHNLVGLVLAGAGARVASMDDEQTRKKTVEEAIEKLHIIHRICGSGQIVNGSAGAPSRNGSADATEEHFAVAAECYKPIAKTCEELGLEFVFEIHMGTLHDTAATTIKLLDMIGSPAVSANLDYGNMFLTPHAEKDIPQICKMLSGRIGYLHVKNYIIPYQTQARVLRLLADGDIDHTFLLKNIFESGYRGAICPEHPWGGDGHYYAPRDLEYLREITESLGW